MTEQPRLFEFRMGERAPETHVVSRSNRRAAELLTGWKSWPGGAMALTGPEGAGKTHLANAWAAEAGARFVEAIIGAEEASQAFQDAHGRIVVDNADGARDDMALVRLLDLARWESGAVLLVGETEPARWRCATPDLVSRLAALPAARLEQPDDELLALVLRRLCRERFIHLSDKAVSYLATHMERTFSLAHALAAELDRSVVKSARPVSVIQAKRALEAVNAGRDAR